MSLRITSKLLCNYLRLTTNLNVLRRHNLSLPAKITRYLNSGLPLPNKLHLNNNLTKPIVSKDAIKIQNVLQPSFEGTLSQEQRILLLRNCGSALANKSLEYRRRLCDQIWKKLTTLDLSIEDYNAYLQTCTENDVAIDHKTFLVKCKPTKETFRLLLQNACEKGNVINAGEILDMMKNKGITIDESVFNLLVLGHTIQSGLHGGKNVFKIMRVAQVAKTNDTDWFLVKGLAKRANKNEFVESIASLKLNESYFIDVLLTMGLNGNQGWLSELTKKLDMETLPRHLRRRLENICVDLIHQGFSKSAVEIYCKLVDSTKTEGGYGKCLIEEMLSIPMDMESLLYVINHLKNSDGNVLALENATEMAFRKGDVKIASELLYSFEVLRPHYFWPLILHAGRTQGEPGVTDVLRKMLTKNVPIDTDTFIWYVNRFLDFSNPTALIKRLQGDFTVRQLLTPVLHKILMNGNIETAKELCDNYDVALQGVILMRPLANAWMKTKDHKSTIEVLRKICESNDPPSTDFTGQLLSNILSYCKYKLDFENVLKFVKILGEQKLHISVETSENLQRVLQKKRCGVSEIEEALYDLLDISMRHDGCYIKHPKNMNVDELECHLTELSSKNMETRGVLRRLLQEHTRLGNKERAHELQLQFAEKGYLATPGMKANMLLTYVKNDKLSEAEQMYEEIKEQHPNFQLDRHKVVDFAALVVKENRFDRAVELLEAHAEEMKSNSSYLDRNCWNILSLAKNAEQARKLLSVLTLNGYCTPRNVILGPVVRSYLKCDDLKGAVDFFITCTEKYNCTPLQLVLFLAVVDSKNELLLQRMLLAASKVHGHQKAKFTLIVALAEAGFKQALTKLLSEIGYFPTVILKSQLQRWIIEEKLKAMETLADVCSRLSKKVLDTNEVYLAILQYYSSKNDCEGALSFIKELKESEITFTKPLIEEANNLFDRCKYTVPNGLLDVR